MAVESTGGKRGRATQVLQTWWCVPVVEEAWGERGKSQLNAKQTSHSSIEGKKAHALQETGHNTAATGTAARDDLTILSGIDYRWPALTVATTRRTKKLKTENRQKNQDI